MGIVETDDGERTSVAGGDPLPYLRSTALTAISPDLAAFAEGFRKQPMTQEALLALAQGIEMAVEFSPGSTHVGSTAADAFAAGLGVCQDHTHIFLSCCRYLGVPARYVSGYVHSPGHASNHMATHAWAEAWLHDRWWSFDQLRGKPRPSGRGRIARTPHASFSSPQCGVCCCSMYWRITEIGAPPQLPAK